MIMIIEHNNNIQDATDNTRDEEPTTITSVQCSLEIMEIAMLKI